MAMLGTHSREQSTSDSALDDVATHEILQGLARLHSLVVVSDFEGRIVWMSEDFGSACGGGARHVGSPLCQAFAALRGAPEHSRLTEQVSAIQSHLRHHDTLDDIRLDLGQKDGVSRSLDLSAFRTETQDGRPLLVSIIHPSEPSIGHNAVLRDGGDVLDEILDCAPNAVMAIDPFGFITYANSAVSRIFGLGVDKLVGKPVALLQPQSMEFVKLLSEMEGEGDVRGRELRVERPDGSKIWVSVDAQSRPVSKSRRVATVAFLRDTTAEVTARHQLEQKNSELESCVQGISHDLRTPLVSLLGFTRLLRQDYDHVLDDTGRHFAHRIEQAGRSMKTLVEDLLELSRIGSKNKRRMLVNPRSVLLQLRSELKLGLDEANAELILPEDPPLLLCDRTRLYQLFSNLVGNALQHMGPCKDRRIHVRILTRADHHEVVVEDRGRGIPTEDLEKIFEAFHTGAHDDAGTQSTGMGLAIVREIAETYGGRAWAQSVPGQVTSIHVSLRAPS